MKKLKVLFVVACLLFGSINTATVFAYNFGNHSSATLLSKAWQSLNEGDLEAVLAYTNKCIELYDQRARNIQGHLVDYVKGTKDDISLYWELNDVATALFIQGEAYQKNNQIEKAKGAYKKLIKEYTFGQCWDSRGWFWKPAEAAKQKMSLLIEDEEDSVSDSVDKESSTVLVRKAWKALNANNLIAVKIFTSKCVTMYETEAFDMQKNLTGYPGPEKEEIFEYKILNDVGTCLYIRGEAYRKQEKFDEAKASFQELMKSYKYAQCWDEGGWFWKPAMEAKKRLWDIEG